MADTPSFGGLHFWVRDMQATLAFYRAIGLGPGDPQDGFLHLSLPNGVDFAFATYEVTNRYDPAFEPPAAGAKSAVALQFNLESRTAVDALYQALTGAGYRSHLAPIDAFWGSRYCEVLDPDGNVAGFHSPREPR